MTCNSLTFWEDDDIEFVVAVTIEAGAAIAALTGGTVEVLAERAGSAPVSGTGTVTGATTIRASFADGALTAGLYLVQVAVTVTGQRQTVAEVPMEVRRSLALP